MGTSTYYPHADVNCGASRIRRIMMTRPRADIQANRIPSQLKNPHSLQSRASKSMWGPYKANSHASRRNTSEFLAASETPASTTQPSSGTGTAALPPFAEDFGGLGFQFPGVPLEIRELMEGLMAQVEGAIGTQLASCTTPADVREFHTPQGSSGYISLFPGKDRAKVDKVLVSWLFCKLPGGAALGLSTLAVLMGPSTDTPHLLLEFTSAGTLSTSRSSKDGTGSNSGSSSGSSTAPEREQEENPLGHFLKRIGEVLFGLREDGASSLAGDVNGSAAPYVAVQESEASADMESPSTVAELKIGRMIGVMDLLPRRDPVRHPEYLERIYESTGLEKLRKELTARAELSPYEAPTPYVRALLSPVTFCFSTQKPTPDSEGSSPSDLVGALRPAAEEVTRVWVQCQGMGESVAATERAEMEARDARLFEFGIEADLVRNLPRIYGDEITKRVVEAIRST